MKPRRLRRTHAVLDGAQEQAMKQASRRHGVSLFVLLLAACALVEARRTRNQAPVVAIMVSTRDGFVLQEVVGPLLTTQLLRIEVEPAGGWRAATLLRRVQQATAQALADRDLPIDRLADDAAAAAAARGTRALLLFNAADQAQGWSLDGLQTEAVPLAPPPSVDETEFTSYDLVWEVEAGDALTILLRYDAESLDDGGASALIRGMTEACDAISRDGADAWLGKATE